MVRPYMDSPLQAKKIEVKLYIKFQAVRKQIKQMWMRGWLLILTIIKLWRIMRLFLCWQKNPYNDDSDEKEEANGHSRQLISHSEVAKALKVSLTYLGPHTNATAADNLFMRWWFNIASSERNTCLCQKKFTDFVKPPFEWSV